MKKYFDYRKIKLFRIECMLIVTGVFVMLFGGILDDFSKNDDKDLYLSEENVSKITQDAADLTYPDKYEKQIERLLSEVKGLGKISVAVHVRNEGSLLPSYNTSNDNSYIKENGTDGDSAEEQKNVTESNVVIIKDSEGNESVFYTDKLSPEIVGIAICIRGGASNVQREMILTTIMALYDISASKISITG